MNIRISVFSNPALKRIRELEAEVAQLRRQLDQANLAVARTTSGMNKGVNAFTKWGNQVQWAGRQLQYNFTLPIVLAGVAATKFALDNEKAMVRVVKVYGDGSEAMNQLSKTEIPALEKAFVALSNRFGIAQADAINIAADWAAAGASGRALANSVKLTMETMILGEMQAKEATEALIAIQAQYNQSTAELSQTIDILNMVENQTGISMAGLVQGMARSAGVARTMGVDVQHLAAMMAALVPATGGAAAAGNGLKTILSRLMSPTNEANEVMRLMGINTKELSWQSLNATQRLEKMAATFVTLDDAQKIVVASTAASRWQINRFGQLMNDINNPLGYYHRSLEATSDSTRNLAQRQKELDTVLESSPQRLKQMWVMLQNSLAQGIQPMIPAILIMTNAIAKAAQAFAELDPAMQKFALAALFVLAAIGPLVRYMGSVSVLLGVLHGGFLATLRAVYKFGGGIWWLVSAPFKLLGSGLGLIIKGLGLLGPAFMAVGGYAMAAFAPLGRMIVGFFSPLTGVVGTLLTRLSIVWARFMVTLRGIWIRGLGFMSVIWTSFWQGLLTIAGAGRAMLITLWQAMTASLTAIQIAFSRGISMIWMALQSVAIGVSLVIQGAWARAGAAMALLAPGAMVARFKAIMMALPAMVVTAGGGIVAAVSAVGSALWAALGALATWPAVLIGIAIAAAVGIIYNFRNDIKRIFESIPEYLAENFSSVAELLNKLGEIFGGVIDAIIDVFWKLPEGVRNAMLTVLNIIKIVAQKVYEWFSYLNPFAKHSPSLVDQVRKGMAIIRGEYGSLGNVGSIFAKAASDLAKYKSAIAGMKGGEWSDERANVASSFASALPLFDALVADLKKLNAIMRVQEAAVNAQQLAVDKWEASLDAANATLDVAQDKLDKAKDHLDQLTDAYAAHKDALDAYASAPLKGMGQMEDAIFANDQAQKQLRLEMLKWEEVNGPIEDVQSSMAALAGDMERLRGEQESLRMSGAGSDILGPIQSQIDQMQSAYDSMNDTVQNSPINDMQAELERLAREGEMLDLEKSLQFDSLQRQIEQLVDTSKELTFDQITAGIKNEQAAMAGLQPQIDAATKAVKDQQAAVDAAKASRDAIQATYEAEKAKLDQLSNSYDRTADAVRNIESALNDMGSAAADASSKARAAADSASGYMSPGAQNFIDAAGGNFPDVAGSGEQIGREGKLTDQTALIDQFTKDTVAEMEKTLGKIDMFGPIKEKWNQFTGWLETNVWSRFKGIGDDIANVWNDLTSAISGGPIGEGAAGAWDAITSSLSSLWEWGQKLWNLFKDDLLHIWEQIVQAGKDIWNEIGPELAKFKDLVPGLTKIFGFLWQVIKVVAAVVGVALIGALKVLTSILSHVIGPILDMIIGVFKNLIKILRGVIEFVVGVFTGDWEQAWQGIKDIVTGLFGGIADIITGVWDTIWGAVEGLVNGVIDWFKWLADELVGHSIIPDMINDIIDWFKSLPGKIWDAIKGAVNKVVDIAKSMWYWFKYHSEQKWAEIVQWLKGLPGRVWDNIKGIIDKVKMVASNAWDGFKANASAKWSAIVAWIKTLPGAAWEAIKAISTKLGDIGRTAMSNLWSNAKAIWDGAKGIYQWFKDLPGKIAGAMASIGKKVADAVKSAWNGAAKWINSNGIGNINKVTSKLGFTLKELPTFRRGGVIPGKVSAMDNTIIAARTGEGVIVPELVRHLGGARGLDRANKAAASGNVNALRNMGLEGYADGGVIGKISGWLQKGTGYALSSIIKSFRDPVRRVIPDRPYVEDWTVGNLSLWADAAKKWGDKNDSGSGGIGGRVLDPSGYQNMIKAVKAQFPDAIITSSFRPGAITALGNTSMHSIGRAIDIAPRKDIFNWIRSTYGANTRQLFYSPEDGRTLLNGRNWNMDPTTKAGHWDHVHWGYDKGGILPPGLTMARNATGKNEYTLTAEQWQTFSNVVALLDAITLKSGIGATPGAAAMARVGATLATVEGRLRSANDLSTASVRSNSGGGDTYNFYGDLEFPNVKNGDDAEDFLKHLKGLGG